MKSNTSCHKQLRNKVIDIYRCGKGYKAISQASGLQRITVKLGIVGEPFQKEESTKISPRMH